MKTLHILLCSILFVTLSVVSRPSEAGERVAVVIGVSDYAEIVDLDNAVPDARLIAGSLEAVGFDVRYLAEPSVDAVEDLVDTLETMGPEATFLFYFAGHGVQIMGENFLLLQDARVSGDTVHGAFPLSHLMKRLATSRATSVVVLDACRTNPLDLDSSALDWFLDQFPDVYQSYAVDDTQQRQLAMRSPDGGARGLSRVDFNPPNTLLAYSTRAGAVSFDGVSGQNGPFAKALAQSIGTADVELVQMFRDVRDRVVAETDGLQEPFVYGSLSGSDIYLNPQQCPCDGPVRAPEILACQKEAAPLSPEFPLGRNVEAINPDTAIPACDAALAVDPGNPLLHFWMGRAQMAARDDERARDYLLVAAQNGIGPAMHNMAILYNGGRGLNFEPSRAQLWFEQAEERNILSSRSNLAWFFETGRGGVTNFERAFELYAINAEAGEAFSQRKLAHFYREGLGGERSIPAALHWFHQAAMNGDLNAMYEIAVTLTQLDFDGNIQDITAWLVFACGSGNADALEFLKTVAARESGDPLRLELVRLLSAGDVSYGANMSGEALMTLLHERVNSVWYADLRRMLSRRQYGI